MWSAGPGDDQARFLADLRALRDMAAIGHDELAARAHYPSDILKEAENGPLLPGLPILTAYVRACDGNVPDWEERWRRLTSEIPEDPDLPVRPPGASPAAVAGARAGVGIAPPEVYDPERIKAALRGGHARSGQGGSAAGGRNGSRDAGARSKAANGWGGTPGWDAASDETVTMANGNHTATSWSPEPFDAAAAPAPTESAEHTDQFRWLPDEESASPQSGTWSAGPGQADTWRADTPGAETGLPGHGQTDTGTADTGLAGTGLAGTGLAGTGLAGTGLAGTGLADSGQAGTGLADTGVAGAGRTDAWRVDSWGADNGSAGTSLAAETDVEPAVSEWTPRWDDAAKPAEGTDFWSTSTGTPAADLQQPAAAARQVDEQTYPQASWSASARTEAASSPQSGAIGSTASTGSTASARFAPAQSLGHQAAAHQKDRFFPARLLVIIVIAALIGSALVLLLK
jgi:hypothetical protein